MMDPRTVVNKFFTFNRQQQQSIDLLSSLDSGTFVHKTRAQLKRSIARRKRNKAAGISRRANRIKKPRSSHGHC